MKVTVGSEIALLDAVFSGHGIPYEVLSRWLGDIDGYISRQLLGSGELPADYDYAASPDTPLLVQEPPHRRIYFLYLRAMADFALGRYSDYADGIGAYNRAMADYVHFVLCVGDKLKADGGDE
jgi:hypothetical protein